MMVANHSLCRYISTESRISLWRARECSLPESGRLPSSRILEGIVQRVGLRYLIQAKAVQHWIHGYVKNPEDGTVEIVRK